MDSRRIVVFALLGTSLLAALPVSAEPSIDDFAWLVGHWRGEALGGVAEEVWMPPAEGAMVGTFRLVGEDGVRFYEIFTITEPELDLRLKHFEADLVGWEERAEVVTFPFVRVSPTEAVFEGLVFRRLGDDGIRAVVQTRSADGAEGELEFVYERVPAEAPDGLEGRPSAEAAVLRARPLGRGPSPASRR